MKVFRHLMWALLLCLAWAPAASAQIGQAYVWRQNIGVAHGPGEFKWPSDVATDASGRVYVMDNANHRIQVFGPDGAYVKQLGSYGTGNGQFIFPLGMPSGMAFGADGCLYVADTGNCRVQVWDANGNFLRCLLYTSPSPRD